jgi:hypothetical protein
MSTWFEEYGCDGFAIIENDSPSTFEEFGRVPELRRRGLVSEISLHPRTFRRRLGLPDRVAR